MHKITVRDIARGAMLTGIYGVALTINLFLSNTIQDMVPWVFSIPVCIYAMYHGPKTASVVLGAMIGLTFILSGLTTWIIAIPFLITGWLYGSARWIHLHGWSLFLAGVVLLFVSNWLPMTLLADLYGYDAVADQEAFAWLFQYISFESFLGFSALFMALVQSVGLEAIVTILSRTLKGLPAIWKQKEVPLIFQDLPSIFGWLFWPLLLLAIMALNQPEWPSWLRDLLVLAFVLDFILMVWSGWQSFALMSLFRNTRWKAMLLSLGMLVPVLNFVYAGAGSYRLMKKSLAHKSKAGN